MKKTPEARFLEKIEIEIESGCWLWTASKRPNGYAQFSDGEHRVMAHAHRWAYQHFVGPIPEGRDLDHLCRVRHCVNPKHLEPVTRSVNLFRGAGNGLKNGTHCKRGHELTAGNTHFYGPFRSRRRCRTCHNFFNRQYRKEKQSHEGKM